MHFAFARRAGSESRLNILTSFLMSTTGDGQTLDVLTAFFAVNDGRRTDC